MSDGYKIANSICKKRKTDILGAQIRNIDAPGAEINKLAVSLKDDTIIETNDNHNHDTLLDDFSVWTEVYD